jgi:hypothetical protein
MTKMVMESDVPEEAVMLLSVLLEQTFYRCLGLWGCPWKVEDTLMYRGW